MLFKAFIIFVIALMLCIRGVRRLVRAVIWMPIWYVIYFLLCRPWLFMAVLLVSVSSVSYKAHEIVQFFTTGESPRTYEQETAIALQRVTTLPPIQGQVYDGNSGFAEDISLRLNEHQQRTYNAEFYTVMTYGGDNAAYKWKLSERTFGYFKAGKAFTASGGQTCRPYEELLSVVGVATKKNEIACQYVGNPQMWCRRPPKAAYTCEVGYSTEWDRKMSSFKNFFSGW